MLTKLLEWLRGLLGNKPAAALSKEATVKLAMEAAGLRGQDWRGVKATEAFLEGYIGPDLQGSALQAAVTQAAQEWRKANGQRYN